ncbi:TPA: hypothetical protein SLG99_002634 [Serratia marcescens]|nr:hypothetical protein [Serratia marcescens]
MKNILATVVIFITSNVYAEDYTCTAQFYLNGVSHTQPVTVEDLPSSYTIYSPSGQALVLAQGALMPMPAGQYHNASTWTNKAKTVTSLRGYSKIDNKPEYSVIFPDNMITINQCQNTASTR